MRARRTAELTVVKSRVSTAGGEWPDPSQLARRTQGAPPRTGSLQLHQSNPRWLARALVRRTDLA